MKFIFSILLLFNLSFADIITSPAFMFMPNNIFYHSYDDNENQNNNKCKDNCKSDEQIAFEQIITAIGLTAVLLIATEIFLSV